MRGSKTILLLGSLACLAGRLQAEDEIAVWETYLYANEVRDLDYDGEAIWIATGGGVVSYDPATGQSKTYHRSRDGLLSDSLTAVTHDQEGRIWLGTEMVGISILEPESEVWEPFTSLLRPIPSDRIQRLEIKGDTLFVSTAKGLAVFVDGDQKIVCQEGIDLCGLPSFDVRDLATDEEGDGIWVATAEGVAHRDSLGDWTSYPNDDAPSAATRLVRHRGSWLAVFEEGIFRLDSQSGEWFSIWNSGGVTRDLLSEGETLLVAGSQGVWSREGEGTWVQVGDRALPGTALLRLPEGGLWLGTQDAAERLDGMWNLSGSSWVQKRFEGPSLRAQYRAMAFDDAGILYLSHAGSGTIPMVQSFDGARWSEPVSVLDWTFDLLFSQEGDLLLAQCCCRQSGCNLRVLSNGSIDELQPRNLRDIVYDDEGNLWCASDQAPDQEEYAEGIWFYDREADLWTQIDVETEGAELLRNRVRAVLPNGRYLWIGYSDRGLHRWDLGPDKHPLTADDGIWTHYSAESAETRRLISDQVTRLAIAGDRLWVGTAAGLSLIDPDDITHIGSGFFGLPSPVVNALIVLRDGSAWVATSNAGLTRMLPEETGFRFVTYRPPDLPNPNVESLVLDPDGRTVWAGTTRGLARLTLLGQGGSAADPLVAYPNPYTIGCGDGIRLIGFTGIADGVIVDVAGKIIRRFDSVRPGDLVWDGLDASGASPAAGLYWIRLASPEGMRGVGVGLTDGPCPSYLR